HLAEDRYPTAQALRDDLESYLAQHVTQSRERGLGPVVCELFREERAQIRQLIEAQLRGSRPGASALPALRSGVVGHDTAAGSFGRESTTMHSRPQGPDSGPVNAAVATEPPRRGRAL